MKPFLTILTCTLLLILTSCEQRKGPYYWYDPHSAARPNDAIATHLEWEAQVDFESKTIAAVAHWTIQAKANVKEIIFDTDDLFIERVWLNQGDSTSWRLAEEQAFLGRALVIQIGASTQTVHIQYKSAASAKGLQWLEPQQTHDKKAPFLFTQGQAVLTRSWLPCQDSPGIRFTFNATVQVPEGLFAIMSAQNPRQQEDNGIYRFSNPKAIPAYLFALAVGDLTFKPYDGRSGVYAEPGTLDKAWWEFAELPAMIRAAEQLYGPYPWDRYDVLVLPPSFPFGGMENPMVMFATPSIIAGDRSLTNLIAHELSHSWSGNLVTHANWNDFWINEGFTTYIERRILGAIHGEDYVDMLDILGQRSLEQTVRELAASPELTKLKLALEGKNPDDALSGIPYQKGYALLQIIEKEVGRSRMDSFVRSNFSIRAFKSMTTEDFVELLKSDLLSPKQYDALLIDQWIYEPGIPDNILKKPSIRFAEVSEAVAQWKKGTSPQKLPTAGWSTYEWLYFFKNIENKLDLLAIQELDDFFKFSSSQNAELAMAWFLLAIKANHEAAYPNIEAFLQNTGRRKLLVPLYKALYENLSTRELALRNYFKNRDSYHVVTVNTLDAMLLKK